MTDIVDDLHDALAERQKVMKGGGGIYRRAADEIEKLRGWKADVLDLADDVIAYHAGHVSTHYEDCYRHHAGCLAVLLRDMEDD